MKKEKVIFLCTHNSARSQMAEGLLRALYGSYYDIFSAGTKPGILNPKAVKVMDEIGIDISRQRSKSVFELLNDEFDVVVTVCDNAKEACPIFPKGKDQRHKGFSDPAGFTGEEETVIKGWREVRDQIREYIINEFGKGKNMKIILNRRKRQ